MKPLIRKATIKDIKKIAELMLEYGKYENDLDKTVEIGNLREIEKDEINHMKLGTEYLLIEENKKIQGILNINIDLRGKEKIGVLHTIIITKEARGKGYGKLLVNHALSYFKKKGCKRVRTFIHAKNKKAHEFWKKRGFHTEAGFTASKMLK